MTARRRRTRRAILAGLEPHVQISAGHRRRIARDSGGDALDAVVAAVGAATAWASADHRAIASDDRSRREGYSYW